MQIFTTPSRELARVAGALEARQEGALVPQERRQPVFPLLRDGRSPGAMSIAKRPPSAEGDFSATSRTDALARGCDFRIPIDFSMLPGGKGVTFEDIEKFELGNSGLVEIFVYQWSRVWVNEDFHFLMPVRSPRRRLRRRGRCFYFFT